MGQALLEPLEGEPVRLPGHQFSVQARVAGQIDGQFGELGLEVSGVVGGGQAVDPLGGGGERDPVSRSAPPAPPRWPPSLLISPARSSPT